MAVAVAASCPHLTLHEGEEKETQGEHFSGRVSEHQRGADLRKMRPLLSPSFGKINHYFQLRLVQINNLLWRTKKSFFCWLSMELLDCYV